MVAVSAMRGQSSLHCGAVERVFMHRYLACACAALLLAAGSAAAQQKATITGVADIPFTSVPNVLKLPPGETLGESVAVATDSKGHIFVYHRRDTTRLFEFDRNGTFV